MIEIIAEAAQGFLGAPQAKTEVLARLATAATADAVKFQLVYADELCTPDYKHHELFSRLEMPDRDWEALAVQCASLNIGLYVDVFGARSLALAERMKVRGVKLHSTDMLNASLLTAVARSGVSRVIVSAGGCHLDELERALAILRGKELVVMHGFQGYPTLGDENQIVRIDTLRARFPAHQIGFADHVPETDASRLWLACVAVGAGASVIEKHITTASVAKEEDHESALNPDEFAQFAANVRLARAALGESADANDFGMTAREMSYRKQMKKHVVALRDLAAGSMVREEDLTLKRSAATEGVLYEISAVSGKRLGGAVPAGSPILDSMLE